MIKKRIIVVGSANQDYLVRVPRAPRPGETILASELSKQPGGKGANQAVAAARLGAEVHFVGAVGRDDDGASILRALQQDGVSVDDVRIVDGQPTGLALISVEEGGENSITVVSGANATVTAEHAALAVIRLVTPGALVVLQGELSGDVVEASARAAVSAGARVVLNLAPYREVAADVLAAADPLIVNETEAGGLLGRPPVGASEALDSLGRILEHAASVVVTLGSDGAVWATHEERGHAPAPETDDVVDTTGAGDAFVGCLAFALADGYSLRQAVALGTRAGSFAIRGIGAQTSYARPGDLGL